VLFDLDGTLIDTAADIALALNAALAERGVAAIDECAVRTLIGRGAAVLIARALEVRGASIEAAARAQIFERFIDHYAALQQQGRSRAAAYPGAAAALRELAAAGLRLGVVTNKVRRLAVATLDHAGLGDAVHVVVGGDSCARRKPDPEPLLFACQHLGVMPDVALMVGDSVNDVTAARAAGMPVLCVPYGYNEGSDPRTLPCDGFIATLAELPGLLRRSSWQ
jgi:phosphoglycolate phosphatase